MAANTVSEWAIQGTQLDHVVGDILTPSKPSSNAPLLHITPSHHSDKAPRLSVMTTRWRTGKSIIERGGEVFPSPDWGAVVGALLSWFSYFRSDVIAWSGGRLKVQGRLLCRSLWKYAILWERQHLGDVCLEWLPYVDYSVEWLWTYNGERLDVPAECSLLTRHGTSYKDVLHWARQSDGTIIFTPLFKSRELTPRRREQLLLLVVHAVCNHPSLLTTSNLRGELRMTATPPDHPLTARITLDAPGNLLMITSSAEPARTLPIQSHADISRSISADGGGEITVHYVHLHPQLSRQACLWVRSRRWSRTRQFFKQSIEETKRRRAKETLSRRQARWKQDPLAAAGIRRLEWTRFAGSLASAAGGEQLLYRLKSGGLSLYDSTQGKQGCPHSGCVHVRSMTLLHVFWECSAAKALWRVFIGRWRSLGLTPSTAIVEHIFSLELPTVPPGIWELVDSTGAGSDLRTYDDTKAHVHDVLESCWRLGVALFFHCVWRYRVAHFDGTTPTSLMYHKASLVDRLRHGYASIQYYMYNGPAPPAAKRAAAILHKALTSQWAPTPGPIRETGRRYLLFFDGGSRGNPGPGGAGAVIWSIGDSIGDILCVCG